MPGFKVSVPHNVEREEAGKRLKSFSEKVRAGLPGDVREIEERWDRDGNLDFSFRALGFKVSGRLENQCNNIHVSGSIPFAALPFRGAIEDQIAARIREAIA